MYWNREDMTESRKTVYLIVTTLLLLFAALALENIALTFAALVAAFLTAAE